MKNQTVPQFFTQAVFAIASLIISQSISVFAQHNHSDLVNDKTSIKSAYELSETELRQGMKMEGATDAQIDAAMVRYKEMNMHMERIDNNNYKKENPLPVPCSSCSDIGVDNGWGPWIGQVGMAVDVPSSSPWYGGPDGIYTGCTYSVTYTPPPAPATYPSFCSSSPYPAMGFYNLTSGPGNDPCTPGPIPGSPAIPLTSPFGNAFIQMGVRTKSFTGAEILTYNFAVTSQDTNFIYAYAFVMHDAGVSHNYANQPYVSIIITKANGDTVPCSYQRYTGGNNIPGSYLSDTLNTICTALGYGGNAKSYYKPWSVVGVNLSAYIGQTLKIKVINRDCVQGGHWAWSYWDFSCGVIKVTTTTACSGGTVSLCAPKDPLASNTYQWYQNTTPFNPSNHWSPIPGGNTQCINQIFAPGDSFMVHVKQPSGCDFYLVYAPQGSSGGITSSVTPTNAGCNSTGSAIANVSGGSAPYTYNWSNGQSSQTATGLTAGNFTVTVTDASGCTSTATVTITSSSSLSVSTNSTQQQCNTPGTATATPTGGSAPYTYAWNNGQTNATATGLAAGNYTVTVTSANGCTGTQTVSITSTSVFPIANFNSGPVCLGTTTQFTDNSSGSPSTWNWNFGNGNTSTAQNPSYTYTAVGTYSVTLIVANASGCPDTVTIPVTVDPIPTAIFSPASVCFNNPIPFANNSTGNPTQWLWNFGDGNTSTLQSPSHTYSAPGTYTASLVVTTASGCKDSTKQIIHINPLPTPNFSGLPVCLGTTTTFSDLSTIAPGNITGWAWNFGEPSSSSNISSVQTPSHTYALAGTYTVVLTVTSDSGCQGTIMIPVQVMAIPVAAFSVPNQCQNTASVFTDNSTGNPTIWNWNFGDGSPNAVQQNPSHTYLAAGTYTVTLIVSSAAGCKDTTNNVVTIYPIPVPLFKADTVCAGNPSTFTDLSFMPNGNITGWLWNFGDGGTSTLQNPTHNYSHAGNYSVTITVTSNNGCSSSITVNTTVHAWPKADFCVAPDKAPTTAPVFNFCDQWSNDVVQWWWDFGDNTPHDSSSTDPTHSYSATVTNNDFYNYTITVWVQNQWGCWDTIQKVVEIIPEFEFYIPNAFTPNGDFSNEMFFGKGRGIKEYNIWVFDRWGNLIWDCHREDKNTNWDGPQQEGLASACKWDAKVEGGHYILKNDGTEQVQEDVYVWKVKLTDVFEKIHTYIGQVSVVK
jgi:gliding motility-associated-like protein